MLESNQRKGIDLPLKNCLALDCIKNDIVCIKGQQKNGKELLKK